MSSSRSPAWELRTIRGQVLRVEGTLTDRQLELERPDTLHVATTVDLRLSFDRLAGIVREQMGRDARAPALYVFHNRNRIHLPQALETESGELRGN